MLIVIDAMNFHPESVAHPSCGVSSRSYGAGHSLEVVGCKSQLASTQRIKRCDRGSLRVIRS